MLDLRRQIYPERAETTMVSASVTDPEWVADIPADRPTLVVAEGLTMYLEPEAGRALLRRLAAASRLLYQTIVRIPMVRTMGQLLHYRF